MNFKIGRAFAARMGDVFPGHILAALLHLGGDHQQSFQFARYVGLLEVGLDSLHQVLVAVQMRCGDCSMNGLAVIAFIERGNISGNQLALPGRKRMRATHQDFHKLIQRFCRLWTESQGSTNSG